MKDRHQQIRVLRVPCARFAVNNLFDLLSDVVHNFSLSFGEEPRRGPPRSGEIFIVRLFQPVRVTTLDYEYFAPTARGQKEPRQQLIKRARREIESSRPIIDEFMKTNPRTPQNVNLIANCTCLGSPTPCRRKPLKSNRLGAVSELELPQVESALMRLSLLKVLNISTVGVSAMLSPNLNGRDRRQSNEK